MESLRSSSFFSLLVGVFSSVLSSSSPSRIDSLESLTFCFSSKASSLSSMLSSRQDLLQKCSDLVFLFRHDYKQLKYNLLSSNISEFFVE